MAKAAVSLPDDLKLTTDMVLDRTTCIYGASGSGKSVIIMYILYLLKSLIPQITVICPTDSSNHTYSSGAVPTPLIHHNLTDKLLKAIWNRQEMLAAVYSRANTPSILQKLFEKLGLNTVNKIVEQAHSNKAEAIAKIKDQYLDDVMRKKKTEDIENKFKEFFTLVYKQHIIKHRTTLEKMKLSEDEKFSLRYIDLNPRMVLVFDDCSASFKKIKTKEGREILEKMFFQGRWAFLTVIIAAHDDKILDSELRKNAYISIFTQKETARVYFGRSNNGFPSDIIKQVDKWNPLIFQGHQKLAYIRAENKFYKFTAEKKDDFCFGAGVIKQYCRMIQSEGLTMDTSNDFFRYFAE